MDRIDESKLVPPTLDPIVQHQINLLQKTITVVERADEEMTRLRAYVQEVIYAPYECRTLYCVAGHLAASPEGNAIGLYLDQSTMLNARTLVPWFEGEQADNALNKLFKDSLAFKKYFAKRGDGTWDPILETSPPLSDKALGLARLRYGLLVLNGEAHYGKC